MAADMADSQRSFLFFKRNSTNFKSQRDCGINTTAHKSKQQNDFFESQIFTSLQNQWYFEGVEVKKTAKKAQLSSMYGEMKEGK